MTKIKYFFSIYLIMGKILNIYTNGWYFCIQTSCVLGHQSIETELFSQLKPFETKHLENKYNSCYHYYYLKDYHEIISRIESLTYKNNGIEGIMLSSHFEKIKNELINEFKKIENISIQDKFIHEDYSYSINYDKGFFIFEWSNSSEFSINDKIKLILQYNTPFYKTNLDQYRVFDEDMIADIISTSIINF